MGAEGVVGATGELHRRAGAPGHDVVHRGDGAASGCVRALDVALAPWEPHDALLLLGEQAVREPLDVVGAVDLWRAGGEAEKDLPPEAEERRLP